MKRAITWVVAIVCLLGVLVASDDHSTLGVVIFSLIGAGPWFLLLRGMFRWLSRP
jgi:hypothetical protein